MRAAVERLRDGVARDPDYGRTSVEVARGGGVTRITVAVDGDVVGKRATRAIRDLRERYVPRAFAGTGATALVAGEPARELDFAELADARRPLVFAFVLGLSFVVLVVAFRSVVIPLTAIATNLLSVGAAYGLLVLVFQHGVGADLLGFQRAGTVEAWLPLFLFTILFGLSMDYHVFLLSRIRERYLTTRDTVESVAFGVSTTARLITGAALIMVAVFFGFATGQLVMFQQMGFGLGAAVLIDATLVRSVIVPAAMALLGRWNWWMPGRPRDGARLETGVRAMRALGSGPSRSRLPVSPWCPRRSPRASARRRSWRGRRTTRRAARRSRSRCWSAGRSWPAGCSRGSAARTTRSGA